jgi:hypothetical protein
MITIFETLNNILDGNIITWKTPFLGFQYLVKGAKNLYKSLGLKVIKIVKRTNPKRSYLLLSGME